jgi:hypothetical protein
MMEVCKFDVSVMPWISYSDEFFDGILCFSM